MKMPVCEICGKEVRTPQGLRGHKTFVHGLGRRTEAVRSGTNQEGVRGDEEETPTERRRDKTVEDRSRETPRGNKTVEGRSRKATGSANPTDKTPITPITRRFDPINRPDNRFRQSAEEARQTPHLNLSTVSNFKQSSIFPLKFLVLPPQYFVIPPQ